MLKNNNLLIAMSYHDSILMAGKSVAPKLIIRSRCSHPDLLMRPIKLGLWVFNCNLQELNDGFWFSPVITYISRQVCKLILKGLLRLK